MHGGGITVIMSDVPTLSFVGDKSVHFGALSILYLRNQMLMG